MKLFAIKLTIFFLTQNLFAQNTPPPEMPIPPEFSQPAPEGAQQPPNFQQTPQGQPHQQVNPPADHQPPQQQPIELNTNSQVQTKPKLPDDFELIEIKPYFKNKARLGKLTATLISSQNDTLATVSADFGDCKDCIRGASLKGKLGIRLYGNNLKDLIVSRKQSSSIKLINCNNKVAFMNTYTCEFSHKDSAMKLMLRLEP